MLIRVAKSAESISRQVMRYTAAQRIIGNERGGVLAIRMEYYPRFQRIFNANLTRRRVVVYATNTKLLDTDKDSNFRRLHFLALSTKISFAWPYSLNKRRSSILQGMS